VRPFSFSQFLGVSPRCGSRAQWRDGRLSRRGRSGRRHNDKGNVLAAAPRNLRLSLPCLVARGTAYASEEALSTLLSPLRTNCPNCCVRGLYIWAHTKISDPFRQPSRASAQTNPFHCWPVCSVKSRCRGQPGKGRCRHVLSPAIVSSRVRSATVSASLRADPGRRLLLVRRESPSRRAVARLVLPANPIAALPPSSRG